ncbi:ATP-dependent RNA helicase dbp7 [Schaereria dolodes]|nr:ATP-dependent RNA helicase dbp7 [Schaereria dolodes]
MADDGMLMNLSIGDGLLNNKPVYKGGRWKDRLTAKKSAQYYQQKLQNSGRSVDPLTSNQSTANVSTKAVDQDETQERPQKRQKVIENHSARPRHAIASGKPVQVVSSLFSCNPSSKSPAQHVVDKDLTSVEPSNAPLLDGLDTFTTLGLSTTLATHLLTKQNLRAPTAIQKATITQLIKEDSDAFIQAETGSGKTLAYLLPLVQRIMRLSRSKDETVKIDDDRQVHRDSGLFAIILAPTRELCKQISVVLDSLLHCAHWIVAGTVIGGEKKKSEKARLRKGLNILVATPGRLVDHLENTKVLDVSNVRWLVLDEGDRLMELGFEKDIRGIVAKLEDQSNVSQREPRPGLPLRRTTILCSATMKTNVQRLGEISLKDAVHIKADQIGSRDVELADTPERSFSAPAQLKQLYIICPAKQRLVALAALLKHTFARKGSVMKAIVFLSCADSVEFHFETFARTIDPLDGNQLVQGQEENGNEPEDVSAKPTSPPSPTLPTISHASVFASSQNPNTMLYKLHGSLPQPTRTATLLAFSRSASPCILLCTDVASRGLDLPNIDLVIEYDPPFSADDHLHRVGRTARAGRDGRAIVFLMPGGEEGYVEVLKQGYRDGLGRGLVRSNADEVMKKGFGLDTTDKKSNKHDWEDKATDYQLNTERWVIENKHAGELARKAFVSHVRAYATHVAREREMFDVKALHLGHLAKAFALRERPGSMGRGETDGDKAVRRIMTSQGRPTPKANITNGGGASKWQNSELTVPMTDAQEASRRMRAKMKEHMSSANEFNIG